MEYRWCCYPEPRQRLQFISLLCTVVEAAELLRIILVTEWLTPPTWEKSVLLELLLLLLLLTSNLLLFLGSSRGRPDEVLPWLALHLVALALQAVLAAHCTLTIGLVAIPATQTSVLSLPRGMTSSSPEFLRRQRWTLGVNIGKLLALCLSLPTTAYCCWVVYNDRKLLLAEQASRPTSKRAPSPGPPTSQALYTTPRRQSLARSSMMAAAEARRSQSSLGMASLPRSQATFLERQASSDTCYNVASIRSEVRLDRFDSIDERGPGVENTAYSSSGYL